MPDPVDVPVATVAVDVEVASTSALGQLLGLAVVAVLDVAGRSASLVGEPPQDSPSIVVLVVEHDEDAELVVARRREKGLSTLVVAPQHPDVRVGPLDVPESELCARCFAIRDRQWGTHPAPRRSSVQAGVDVEGYPPYAVALLAQVVVDRVRPLLTGQIPAQNEVCFVNVATLLAQTMTVTPVNGCELCDTTEVDHASLARLALLR